MQHQADSSRYWYTTKRLGLGWRSPLIWQGWAIDSAIFVFFVAGASWFRTIQRVFLALSLAFGTLLLRAAIAHWKGEPADGR